MGKKRRGHYCRVCGRRRPNEKFSGKGHRQHICKDCKRKGKKELKPSTTDFDRETKGNHLTEFIENCLLLQTANANFLLFEYQRERYITRMDFESEIFIYQEDTTQKFFVEESFQKNDTIIGVLFRKYQESIENGRTLEYEDVIEDDLLDVTTQQHLEVILSLNNLL